MTDAEMTNGEHLSGPGDNHIHGHHHPLHLGRIGAQNNSVGVIGIRQPVGAQPSGPPIIRVSVVIGNHQVRGSHEVLRRQGKAREPSLLQRDLAVYKGIHDDENNVCLSWG